MHESDISWQVLRRIVQEWAGTSAELDQVQPLEGGVINTTLCLTLKDGQRAVLKISPHRINRDYEREVHQLELLASLGIPTPKVYQIKFGSLEDPHSFFLMEFIDGVDLNEAKHRCSGQEYDALQQHLADVMLQMHRQTSDVYGRVWPMGGAPTFNSWPAFFRHIYDPILKEAEKNPELNPKSRKQLARIHETLDRLIAHDDVPRLVHWDIWSTNLLAKPNEKGEWRICAVLDPNCKYAHVEAELAYMDLFHTCSPAFMKAYQQSRRLDDSYHHIRKPVYQFYALVDHVSLFGHDYVKPMLAAMEKVAEM